jgi:iron complex outermembrane receptor protein
LPSPVALFLFPFFIFKKTKMKSFWGTIVCSFLVFIVNAQFSIKGTVTNEQQLLEAATITVEKDGVSVASTSTSKKGEFTVTVKTKGSYAVSAQHVNMQKKTVVIQLDESNTTVNLDLSRSPFFLEPLEVKSIRASERAPFTKTNIAKEELEKNNLGQDLPFLLNQTPGVVVNSDAGNGVGYTGIRIRGSDATRVNVTLNGIPYNDAESQGVFFVDLPDIASSVNSIQIQRGVGTSSNGAGAFGATINVGTNEFNDKAYGELNNSYGSFNTWKHTVKAGSGLINGHFTVDARLSKVSSDGFVDRAASDLRSFYFSTAYIDKHSTVRLNIFSGKEKTYQSWYGIPESYLNDKRTYNSAGTAKPGEPYDNETDNYQQDHYQLFFNHAISNHVSFNTALFLSNGKGYYEQYKAQAKFSSYGLANPIINGSAVTRTDLVRQLWLDNSFYGQILSLEYKKGGDVVTIGGGWNQYDGKHYGQIIWAQVGIPKDYRYYNLKGNKGDANGYAKWQHALSNTLQLFGDVQYRHVHYTTNGFRDNPTLPIDRTFDFVNPKAGISYNSNGWQAYISYALGNKEPNREDFEAGLINQPKHEILHDFELGAEKKSGNYTYGATAYYMLYKNQLILTGQVNDVGAYTRTNVPNSYRAGIELQGTAKFFSWLHAAANLALSTNKIKESVEYLDDYDNGGQKTISHKNTEISFSPSVVGGATVTVLPFQNAEINILNKYVSRQYLDNSGLESRSLNPYFMQDVKLGYSIKSKLLSNVQLMVLINNIYNIKYEPNGYTFSYIAGGATATENYYFPMAGTNVMAGVNVKF